jgi:hypothetical protein
MVFSSAWVAAAARVPAELCQRPGQRQRRLRADEVLRALFAPPVHELERLAGCLYLFFCMPLPEPDDQYYYLPASGRGGWVAHRPSVLYSYRMDEDDGLYYLDD